MRKVNLRFAFLAIMFFCFAFQSCRNALKERSGSSIKEDLVTFPEDTAFTANISNSLTADTVIGAARPGIPPDIYKNITIINVRYFGFDSCIHTGDLEISSDLAGEAVEIFNDLLAIRFPIEKIMTIDNFGWSDSISMVSNNTSCFNYRKVTGRNVLSLHAFGRAIDINPVQNPYITSEGMAPLNGHYKPGTKGTITRESDVVNVFRKYGWEWGGSWKNSKDYQHFYKN